MKRVLTTSLAAVLLLSGCGGEDEPAAPAGGSGDVVEISMKDILFIPKEVEVEVGQTVRWTNDEPIVHNATAEEGADFRSPNLQEGDTFEWKADKAGRVDYVCTIHPGQVGVLEVKE